MADVSNFGFLAELNEFELFASATIEAERVYATAPAMCAVGCRKALELAVKWVYAADTSILMPYKDNLQSLIHESTFRYALDNRTWGHLPYIIKLGNLAVHTERSITKSEVLLSLKGLFEFIEWIDYCYGSDYVERQFDESLIPTQTVVVDAKKIKEQESLLGEKDAEIEALRLKIEEMAATFTKEKEEHIQTRAVPTVPTSDDITEIQTRLRYIDVDLKQMGWILDGLDADVTFEYKTHNLDGVAGKSGRIDYVLWGKDGKPLAVIEAKRTTTEPNVGREQAKAYALSLEVEFGRRPMIFTTNGFDTYFRDFGDQAERHVSGVFSKDDLQKLMNRRESTKIDMNRVEISDAITNRHYQKAAIRAVCDNIAKGRRRHLLVMATGTGKTRTASSLTDVLSRAERITNVLFLADRTALVKQAKDDFKQHLPDMSLCNLCDNKDDKNARIIFSTYPTMLNSIDTAKNKFGIPLFTPAHFDLIIVDESHRSIFKKYGAIFDYFDAHIVGLTATPRSDVDRNTYEFFEMENQVPTYAYPYETAVEEDKVLVPYHTIEVETKFIKEGIVYDELSAEDKERFESDFSEVEEGIPTFIPSQELNRFVFNQNTVDRVLQDLMEKGIHIHGGETIGKTIIFAQNRKHAEFIVQRFNALYPQYGKLGWAEKVTYEDSYAQSVIDSFKQPNKPPYIAVSVDMMDTGIDVPICVNLVLFKQIKSKTKFWQMIGRGTRLAPDLLCMDSNNGEYIGKQYFFIFDYCGNFEFFRQSPNGFESAETKTLAESIFGKRIDIIKALQPVEYSDEIYRTWRNDLIDICHKQITDLNPELFVVRQKRAYVERYKDKDKFVCLNEEQRGELVTQIAPIVYMDGKDESAKRFDNVMYTLILAIFEEKLDAIKKSKNGLQRIASELLRRATVPQIDAQKTYLQRILSDEFWQGLSPLDAETMRIIVRELVRFIESDKPKTVYTILTDVVLAVHEGDMIDSGYSFEDYEKKLNRYVEENRNVGAIYKLTHNIPLTELEYAQLETILIEEMDSKETFDKILNGQSLGVFIRRIAKMDMEAAKQAFSEFINDAALNSNQIAFVDKIVNHLVTNGTIDVQALQYPPFDKPVSIVRLFNPDQIKRLGSVMATISHNAERPTA